MNENSEAATRIGQLVGQLANPNAVVREQSREQLIQLGTHEVTQALVLALIDPQTHVRWEAAKGLHAIADPVAAQALMHALDDEDADVRWVAAEGLIVLGKAGLLAVLSGLIKRAGSIAFCKSAHHVLHEMKSYPDIVAPVLQALDHLEPAVAAPPAAYQALVTLSRRPHAE